MSISVDELRSLITYNPETGLLTWDARGPDMFEDYFVRGNGPSPNRITKEGQSRTWNKKHAGKAAGNSYKNQYLKFNLRGKVLLAHRVA